MQDLLSEHPDLVAVFCCNEGASAGASKMFKDEVAPISWLWDMTPLRS